MKLKRQTLIAGLIAFSLSSMAQASLVTNGSMNFTGNTPTGWTMINPAGERWNSFGGVVSPDGGTWFGIQDLAAYAPRISGVGLYQTINGLQTGATYTLSFQSNETHTLPYKVALWDVSLGNETHQSSLGGSAWITDSMTFTATGTSEVLKFAARFLPGALPEILGLDGVSLTLKSPAPVPLPAAVWLFGTAFAGLVGFRKKKVA